MGLGRLELPTSRLSDMSQALVGARERWKQGDFADSALVGASQRSPALLQVVLQLSAGVRQRTLLRGISRRRFGAGHSTPRSPGAPAAIHHDVQDCHLAGMVSV